MSIRDLVRLVHRRASPSIRSSLVAGDRNDGDEDSPQLCCYVPTPKRQNDGGRVKQKQFEESPEQLPPDVEEPTQIRPDSFCSVNQPSLIASDRLKKAQEPLERLGGQSTDRFRRVAKGGYQVIQHALRSRRPGCLRLMLCVPRNRCCATRAELAPHLASAIWA